MTATEPTFESIARLFFSAIEASDIYTVESMFAEDFTLWMTGVGKTLGKKGTVRNIAGLIARTTDRHYDVLDRQVFDGGFVQQHRMHGAMLDGNPFLFRVAVIMRVNADGMFTHSDEYLDFAEMGPLRPNEVPLQQ